ncbi:MAG: DUF4097 family beta strand repeat-containing protein [Acidobacteriota bacterium]
MTSLRFRALLVAASLAAAIPAAGETTRTLRVEVPAGAFAVENLAGRMNVRAGGGDRVVVIATVHADTPELADRFRLETVNTAGATSVVRVRYPHGEDTIRYRTSRGTDDDSFLFGLFNNSSHGSFSYDGRTYRVSGTRGRLLYANLEIEVPARDLDATFRNRVGTISASGLSGRLSFDVASADVRVDHLSGNIRLNGSSGDVQAADIHGSWKSDFSSGDIVLERFSGERADFASRSGDVRIASMEAAVLSLETSSGDLKITDAEIADVSLHTGSGDILLESRGRRLDRLQARTGSGDVALRIPREAPFEAHGSFGSGDMHVGFTDGTATVRSGEMIAYRRGSGGVRINVDTGSGNLTIEPR